jgi:hypothetical protein
MWSGPALAVIGVIAIAVVALLPVAEQAPLCRWILTSVLTPERVLPSIGFGVAISLVNARTLAAACLLFALGTGVGFAGENHLLRLLDVTPQASTHLFLTSPISYLAVGAALASSSRQRVWLLPVAASIFGAMQAVMIKLTDPSLHEPAFTWTPVLIAVWIIAAISLTVRAFWRDWFSIFSRILGSWLLAIGLLYGGASLVPRRETLPSIVETPDSPRIRSSPNQAIPGLPMPDQPGQLPPDVDQFRQR